METKSKGTIDVGGKALEAPVYGGTIGPDVLDIRALYGKTGMFTYDPGFLSTASCASKITYIDGDQGILLYRGYPIEQLAVNCDFLQVCYLLLYGELPTQAEKDKFVWTVTRNPMVNDQLVRLYSSSSGQRRGHAGHESRQVHRFRHDLPVRPGARLRQRRGAQHADRAAGAGRRREVHRVREKGEGQELGREAHGGQPPRLQELRPARE